jgi:hypothetical protein
MAVHKGTAYPGEHRAIIAQSLWDKVQAILATNGRVRANRTRAQTPALLQGLIHDPHGWAMTPTHTRKRGRLYRYYVSTADLKIGRGTCLVGRVPAAEIESIVIDQVRHLFRTPEIVVRTWRAARRDSEQIPERGIVEALQNADRLWEQLFPAEQSRLVQLLVERVDVEAEGVRVKLRVEGLASVVERLRGVAPKQEAWVA